MIFHTKQQICKRKGAKIKTLYAFIELINLSEIIDQQALFFT